jgi:hypothetical protein
MIQKGFDFWGAYGVRVAFLMEKDKPFNPMATSFFSSETKMPATAND